MTLQQDPAIQPKARRRWPRRAALVLLVLGLLLSPVAWSFTQALTAPGGGGWKVESVDWLREHGGNSIVDRVELWYYTRKQPPRVGRPTNLPSSVVVGRHLFPQAAPDAPPVLRSLAGRALPHEGAWVPGPLGADRRPTLFTTWFRVDRAHPTLVVGVAWMNQHELRFHLGAGTHEPGGTNWSWAGQVPFLERPSLVAAFNSGFKLPESKGGFYLDGQVVRPLLNGVASIVIDRNGVANIGTFGSEVRLTSKVVAVRQNLHLIVDHGRIVPGIVNNLAGLWGSHKSQFEYTWRSGLGVDARGNLIYVGGDKITLSMLADALVHAGAVRGMQLDIHDGQVGFSVFDPMGHLPPRKLLPAMIPSATRYLHPNRRDFLGATRR